MISFREWMVNNNLSLKSADNYFGAMQGVLNDWAQEANIITENLLDIEDPDEFQIISSKIKDLDIFLERNNRGNSMYGAALKHHYKYLIEVRELSYNTDNTTTLHDIEDIFIREDINTTEKQALVIERIGQRNFREKLIKYWEGCAITKSKLFELLVASHIKPWKDSTDIERLDVYNGLLLSPNFDKAFDAGFITFKNTGHIIISKKFEKPEHFNINKDIKISLNKNHYKYMDHHRNNIFKQ